MSNLTKDIHLAIVDDNINDVDDLLDRGAPMIVDHFVLATQMKLYSFLNTFLRRGWNIDTDVDSVQPSALV